MARAKEQSMETSQGTERESKTEVRKRLGLVGAGAQQAAFKIHSTGGVIE